ncbi:MAG: exodeoxyribonuclease VII small subunit [Bacteroidales bacterium]|nr:exodeoxyribonuclease VII small subunit [Clostridium sp.]MCM1202640.1 exodeoxyribonuclease VII small subunit [Bacteroidales bacterium]
MAGKKKAFQVEEAFKEIEEIIGRLESDEVPLKDSLDLYSKGAKLLAECKQELTGIEKEMIIIGEHLEADGETE